MTLKRLGLLLVLLAHGRLGAAQPPGRAPEVGTFLVADGGLMDPHFQQTVVLVLVHGDEGTFGIVVNAPTPATLGELVDEKELGKAAASPVYLGGPVSRTGMLALLRTDEPPEGAERLFGDVFLVTFDQALERYEGPQTPLRFYLGHAGWGAGQLEAEMSAGAWNVVPANDRHLFDMDPRLVWHALKGREMAGGAAPPVPYRGTDWKAATMRGEWSVASGW